MPIMKTSWVLAAVAVCLSVPASAAPKVVASIKPVASLVAGVMAGVGAPSIIVGGGQSLHTFSMKPSDAKALNEAEVVFWVGPGLEAFLEKPINALAGRAVVVALADAPGLRVLKGRAGGVWEKDSHDHGDHGHNHDHDHDFDGHIWLDPMNAKAMVNGIYIALSEVDAANAAAYEANAKNLSARIDALDAELKKKLAPVAAKPFVVFHDGYQYLETRYGLNAVGSLTVSPDRLPGARRVSEIRAKVASLKASCVFAEPQFEPKLVNTLIEGTAARTGSLDPEASTLPAGEGLYFDLMRGLAGSLTKCLAN